MEKDEDIKLLLAEEQTLLSRERTMHSYMQTGLAFTSVGLLLPENAFVSPFQVALVKMAVYLTTEFKMI